MSNGSNEISTRSGDNKGFVHAVMNEDLEAVSYYLSIGMDVNFLDPETMTCPLIEAVKLGNREIARLLVAKGANPSIVSQLGESPIKTARQKGDVEMLDILGAKDSYRSRFINFCKKLVS